MISRNSEGGFFAAHWDWLVAGAGVLALVVSAAMFFMSGGIDPDDNASESVRRLMSAKKSETGVKPVVMTPFERSLQMAAKPPLVAEVPADDGNFLVSSRRVMCKFCNKPIPGDNKTCIFCKKNQPEPEKVVLDTDGDGLPDEWEKKYGLSISVADADADADSDGFTNAEEYEVKTDPSDKKSHPDYLDFVKIQLPLKETTLPFYLRSYMKTPNGMKLEFFDPKERNDYGTLGKAYSIFVGSEIGDTGYTAKNFEEKRKKEKIAGSNVSRNVDISFATVMRKQDRKEIVVPIAGERPKRVPVDVQATLTFSRGTPSEIVVVPGTTFKLYDDTYKVTEVIAVGKGAKVTVEDRLGKIRTLEAVDQ